MKLKKIDILLAERRHVSVDYGRTHGGYRIIQCPFCFTQSSIYARNLIKGARCLEHYHLTGDRENALLREVRETLGKEEP